VFNMLDQKLLAQPPIWNELVTAAFRSFPVYLNHHRVTAAKKRLHTQPGVEIDITHEGKAYFVVDGKVYPQQQGSLIILPGHLPHQLYTDTNTPYRRTVLCLDQRGLEVQAHEGLLGLIHLDWIPSDACRTIHLTTEVYVQLKRLCVSMRKEMDTRHSGWENMVFSHILELSVLIQRSLEQDNQNLNQHQRALSQDVIEVCSAYIQDHLHEDLSLNAMAQMLAVSPEHLTRLFKKAKGISYYQYVLMQRIQEGKRLLQHYPEMSITEVAYQTGFPSSSHFSNHFKRLTGLTATNYQYSLHDVIKNKQDDPPR